MEAPMIANFVLAELAATEKVKQFLNDFAEWAYTQPDIQAVALVGSYARNAATATSDVDLVVVAHDPEPYLHDQAWLERFGEIRQQQVEDYGLLTSIRAWYSDGREVEYGITSEQWAAAPLDEGTRQVISDGIRILFERGEILSRWYKFFNKR
jgi:predicted nucleotidyltransferase